MNTHKKHKYDVHQEKRDNHWEVIIKCPFRYDSSYGEGPYVLRIKSHRWSLTGKWTLAKITIANYKVEFRTKEEILELVELLAVAGKYAIEMDYQHNGQTGPTEL